MADTPSGADCRLWIVRLSGLALSLLLFAGLAPLLLSGQATYAASASPHVARLPLYTMTHYEETTVASYYYYQGCDMGKANLSGVAVLDFGQPWHENSSYGTNLIVSDTFVPDSLIAGLAENYLVGFWNCSSPQPFLTLAIGTSNDFGWTNYSHGVSWAQMVNQVGSWIQSKGYAIQETVAGASDIETDWTNIGNVANSLDWVNGYNAYHRWPYYDYGDAGGCPTSGNGSDNGQCNNGWTQYDIWFVSWASPPALPLPEIYTESGSMASEWYQISLYGYVSQNWALTIQGSYTQYAACQTNGPCPGTDNTPAQGWTQLYTDLNADQRTAQSLLNCTDVTYSQS
jgi:hypothetical protein